MNDTNTEIDPGSEPAALNLDELRSLRSALQADDDAVSYVRRVAQARLDLVRSEQDRRSAGTSRTAGDITGELAGVLGAHLTGGGSRPPRPADDFSSHPLALELEALCNEVGGDPAEMSDAELAEFSTRLGEFERARSEERRVLFERIDGLSAELVRRYRDGEADVEGLLADE
jgi:hypothetical protein